MRSQICIATNSGLPRACIFQEVARNAFTIHRFFAGLGNSIVPIAMVMAVELLGPKHAVIGIVFIPGESH